MTDTASTDTALTDTGTACCSTSTASTDTASTGAGSACCSDASASPDVVSRDTPTGAALVEAVRERYATTAASIDEECCDTGCCARSDDTAFGATLYSADEIATLPKRATEASLGCGNPIAVAELNEGETVLDLGSGGGIDVLLSATRVGPTGFAYGLDMTDEMLELARTNQKEAGATNVEFLKGYIEDIPLGDGTVDVIISNCVINLSVDKPKVLAEMARVLRPGGRIGISDVVADNHLTEADRRERGEWVGCIAGALSFEEYEQGLADAGFTNITVTPTHEATNGMHAAIIRATTPAR